MTYRVFVLGLVFMGAVLLSHGQEGSVQEQKDSLIALLQEYRAAHGLDPVTPKMISLGTRTVDKRTGTRVKTRGFRVQIYSGVSRNEANSVQARFQNIYSDIAAYLTYDEPNYRVKVGDFRSRAEATNLMRELRANYNNVFVFTEDIWVYE